MKLKRIMEAGSPNGEKLKLLALKHLDKGLVALETSKKHFEAYADTIKRRNNETEDIEDFAEEFERGERNRLLAACDWTQVPDSPLSSDDKAAWAAYRTELRNVPSQTGFPTNIVWPTPPDGA